MISISQPGQLGLSVRDSNQRELFAEQVLGLQRPNARPSRAGMIASAAGFAGRPISPVTPGL
jgi:hypothetical protein